MAEDIATLYQAISQYETQVITECTCEILHHSYKTVVILQKRDTISASSVYILILGLSKHVIN